MNWAFPWSVLTVNALFSPQCTYAMDGVEIPDDSVKILFMGKSFFQVFNKRSCIRRLSVRPIISQGIYAVDPYGLFKSGKSYSKIFSGSGSLFGKIYIMSASGHFCSKRERIFIECYI